MNIGDGGLAVVLASPTRSMDGTIVGGWPFDAAVTSTETGCSYVRSSDDFIGSVSGE